MNKEAADWTEIWIRKLSRELSLRNYSRVKYRNYIHSLRRFFPERKFSFYFLLLVPKKGRHEKDVFQSLGHLIPRYDVLENDAKYYAKSKLWKTHTYIYEASLSKVVLQAMNKN